MSILSSREEKLRKLEEALLEGRISEETYRELKAKYEMETEALKKERRVKREEEGVVEKIKDVFETAKVKAEVKLIESKMDKVAERIGKRIYELIKSGEYEATDPELKALIDEMRELEKQKERLGTIA